MQEPNNFPIEIADKIVKMLHQATGDNVNFMDETGVIIATMQPNRLGQVHEGGRKVMSGLMDELAITAEEAQKMQGILPGYMGVVKYKDKRIGCIGLTGDPQKMRPLQKLAAIIVREEYEKYEKNKQKEDVLNRVIQEIEEISASIQEISSGSQNVFKHSKEIEESTARSEGFIQEINKSLKSVKQIGDQTTLLGFNASIESARAGEYGKGFGVVAQEIRKLAIGSAESLNAINQILNEIKESISEITKEVHDNTSITQSQSEAIQNMSTSIERIQQEMGTLTEKE